MAESFGGQLFRRVGQFDGVQLFVEVVRCARAHGGGEAGTWDFMVGHDLHGL